MKQWSGNIALYWSHIRLAIVENRPFSIVCNMACQQAHASFVAVCDWPVQIDQDEAE